jgi:hypothetical protein
MTPETVSPALKPCFGGADRALMPRFFAAPLAVMLLDTRYSGWLRGAYEIGMETAYWVFWPLRKEAAKSTMPARLPNTLSTGE